MTSFDKYGKLFQEVKELTRPRLERNIFSIGGRRHFENPITDLLAFFIDPEEEHGFGFLFLKSLFESANLPVPLLKLPSQPVREHYTSQGNKMDIFLESEDWLLVIENKVRAKTNNPFDDYVQYTRASYRKKNSYFILLSVQKEKPLTDWRNVTWRTYVNQIKKNAGFYLTGGNVKWHILMREWLANIESECGDGNENMNDARIEFVRSNYKPINEMEVMLKEYIIHMRNRAIEAIKQASGQNEVSVPIKQENWTEAGVAIRLHSSAWGTTRTDITLLLIEDGSLRIQFYVDEIADEKVTDLRNRVDGTKYKHYWVETSESCFGFYNERDHDKVFQEIKDVARRLNAFYAPPLGTI